MPKKYIPPYAVAYIDSIKQAHKSFEKSRFYYDKEENAVVEILMINTKDTRKKIKTGRIWKIENKSSFWNDERNYKHSRKKRDIAQWKIEQRRKDPTFAEIEKNVAHIATEYNYDYETFLGQPMKYRNTNTKRAICDGYANVVTETLSNHQFVDKAEKWTSETGKHAWNLIHLKDGRKLYIDATWYYKSTMDNEGYIVTIPEPNPTALTFDIEEFNSLGETIDTNTGEKVKTHFAWEDSKLAE
jgi:hypothetical protein